MRIDEIAKKKGLTPSELGRIGGKKPKKRRPYTLSRNRNCDARCPLYGKCIFQPLSKEKFNGKCALANMTTLSEAEKNKYIKILTAKEDFLVDVMTQILGELQFETTIKGDYQSKRNLYYDVIKLYQLLYGEKKKVEFSGTQTVGITLDDLKKVYKQVVEDENKEDENK